MSNEKFQLAVSLFKSGDKKRAEELLLEIVGTDSSNAEVWYGLALCSDVVEKKKFYLEKVLAINPQHHKASELLITTTKATSSVSAERTNTIVQPAQIQSSTETPTNEQVEILQELLQEQREQNKLIKENNGKLGSLIFFVITLIIVVAWSAYQIWSLMTEMHLY